MLCDFRLLISYHFQKNNIVVMNVRTFIFELFRWMVSYIITCIINSATRTRVHCLLFFTLINPSYFSPLFLWNWIWVSPEINSISNSTLKTNSERIGKNYLKIYMMHINWLVRLIQLINFWHSEALRNQCAFTWSWNWNLSLTLVGVKIASTWFCISFSILCKSHKNQCLLVYLCALYYHFS